MPIELEVKILNIEIPTIKQKLSKLQAEYGGGKLMKRYIFDFNPPKKDTWIRLRDNGNTVTLAIKEIVSNQIDGTKELETKVDSLETTHAMLIKMGFTQRLYQENRRTSYKLHGVDIEIDEWPMIPAYLEIEGKDIESIEHIVSLLGYQMSETTTLNTEQLYTKHGYDLNSIKNLII